MKTTPSNMGWKTKIINMTNSGDKVSDIFPPGTVSWKELEALGYTPRPGATPKEIVEAFPDYVIIMAKIAPLEKERNDLRDQLSKFRSRLSKLNFEHSKAGFAKRAMLNPVIAWTKTQIQGHSKTLSNVLKQLQPLYQQKNEIMEKAKQVGAAVSVPLPGSTDLIIDTNGALTTQEQADENDEKAKKKKRNEQIALIGSIVFAIIIVIVLVTLWGRIKKTGKAK